MVISMPCGSIPAQSLKSIKPFFEMEGRNGINEMLGFSIAVLGDINGDGWPDFATNSLTLRKTLIYFGGPGILDDVPDVQLEGGYNVLKGDVNGDGYIDIISHKPCKCIVPDLDRDTVFVYLGKPGPGLRLNTTPAVRIHPDTTDTINVGQFWTRGMVIGDLNADGKDDFVILDDFNKYLFVYMGKNEISSIPDFVGRREYFREEFWNCYMGDVNGDGVTDLLIAVNFYWNPGDPPPPVNYTLLDIYYGRKGAWTFNVMNPDQEWNSRSTSDSLRFGASFAAAHILDANNDGIEDIWLWPYPYKVHPRSLYDSVFVYFGRHDSIRYTPDLIIANPDTNRWRWLGSTVSRVPDVNGDSWDDYFVTLSDYTSWDQVLYLGNAHGITPYQSAKISYWYDNNSFGDNLFCVGDINGDGLRDYITSSWRQDVGFSWGYVCIFSSDTTLVASTQEYAVPSPDLPFIRSIYPNPIIHNATIAYYVPRNQRVSVDIMDMLGRSLKTLWDGSLHTGDHLAEWDGADRTGARCDPGLYFCRITIGGMTNYRKLILAH